MRDQVAFLQDEIVRKDQIIAAMTQRMAALPAPSADRPDTYQDVSGRVVETVRTPSRPWWQFWR